MDRSDKNLVGALVPKAYAAEIHDKLASDFRRPVPLTYLVRTLLGLWFDGEIIIKPSDIETYKADRRKNNKFGEAIADGAFREGLAAAEAGHPFSTNPHGSQSKAYQAWAEGWNAFFNKV